MDENRFSYNADLSRLELDGKVLCEGEAMEVCVFGYWIPGHLALDTSGWYLKTLDQMGVRLREGLLARRPQGALLVDRTSDQR